MKKSTIISIIIIILLIVFVINSFKRNNKTNNATINLTNNVVNYIEKIDKLSINKFSKNNQLLANIKAERYINTDKNILLIKPNVTAYAKGVTRKYNIKANFADYINNKIKFTNNIKINTFDGSIHNIQTKELIFVIDKKYIFSDNEIFYSNGNYLMKAEGIDIFSKKLLKLRGKNTIFLSNNNKIISKNLAISSIGVSKNYYSSYKSSYVGDKMIITANRGVNFNNNILQLLGQTTIKQKKFILKSIDLTVVDNIFSTNSNSSYSSKNIKIYANKFIYNKDKKIIELKGGVRAYYY